MSHPATPPLDDEPYSPFLNSVIQNREDMFPMPLPYEVTTVSHQYDSSKVITTSFIRTPSSSISCIEPSNNDKTKNATLSNHHACTTENKKDQRMAPGEGLMDKPQTHRCTFPNSCIPVTDEELHVSEAILALNKSPPAPVAKIAVEGRIQEHLNENDTHPLSGDSHNITRSLGSGHADHMNHARPKSQIKMKRVTTVPLRCAGTMKARPYIRSKPVPKDSNYWKVLPIRKEEDSQEKDRERRIKKDK